MSRKTDNCVLVIDVESTCWDPPQRQETSEIIEIGVTVVDTTKLLIVDSGSIMVKPQMSKVSEFCTKLTTLNQEMVDKGILFHEAMTELKYNYNSENRAFVSWGDYDRKMFERNCKDFGVKYPFGPRHMNLKNSFTILHGLDRELGMDAALQYLGISLEGTHHRGGDDARNIANILIHILKKFRGI